MKKKLKIAALVLCTSLILPNVMQASGACKPVGTSELKQRLNTSSILGSNIDGLKGNIRSKTGFLRYCKRKGILDSGKRCLTAGVALEFSKNRLSFLQDKAKPAERKIFGMSEGYFETRVSEREKEVAGIIKCNGEAISKLTDPDGDHGKDLQKVLDEAENYLELSKVNKIHIEQELIRAALYRELDAMMAADKERERIRKELSESMTRDLMELFGSEDE